MVTLQDEIVTKSDRSWVYWSVNVNAGANINISEDGRSALLEMGGEHLYVEIAAPSQGRFMIYDAMYYPNQSDFPLTTGQSPNSQQKLVIRLTNVEETTISVNFVPLERWETKPSFERPAVIPMEYWNIPDGEIPAPATDGPQLDGIRIDGQPLAGFNPSKTYYEHTVPLEQIELPVVEGIASGNKKITTLVNERYAFIFVEQQGKQTVYSIKLNLATRPETAQFLEVVDVTASDYQEGNPPENAVDGINADHSRWSAEGVQHILLDLGDVYDVGFVSIALFNGDVRSQLFNIYLSVDGETFIPMFDEIQRTSGTTDDFETVRFALTEARYVKIQCYGNSVSGWNSIKEIEVYGYSID